MGENEALLDTGADITIGSQSLIKRLGIFKNKLKPIGRLNISGANQVPYKLIGSTTLHIQFEGKEILDTIMTVKEDLDPPLIIRWDTTTKLRNDYFYPRRINVDNCDKLTTNINSGVRKITNTSKVEAKAYDEAVPKNPTKKEMRKSSQNCLKNSKTFSQMGKDNKTNECGSK